MTDLAALGLVTTRLRPAIPGPAQTVAEVLDHMLATDPGREALVGRHARYTYRELDNTVNRAAGALAALGVKAGDRVAASLGNHTELVVAFLATQRLGAIWVGINRPLAPPEKAYILASCQACVFLGDAEMAAQVSALGGELQHVKHVVVAEPRDPRCAWQKLLDDASAQRPSVVVDPFAPAAISYTSGTTGFPKGAVHSQHNLLVLGAATLASYAPHIRHGVMLPLTQLNLMVLVPLLAFQAGTACVLIDKTDPLVIAEWVRRERIGHFTAVPAVYHDLLTHPDVAASDLATLERPEMGGADCPQAFRKLYRERFGADVIVGYGMTEAPATVTRSDDASPIVPGICGRALPHTRIHIWDDAGRELGPGEIGEICIGPATEGPFAAVYTHMLGYWNDANATAEALRGGVFHSADLGSLDEHGNLLIKGRRKEVIIRGGANVYPAEVERVLHEDPRVAACAVLGKADERLGERVVAVVELKAGLSASADELREHCLGQLARYKVPKEFVFVDRFPRNAMGKIVKKDLRRLVEA
jgi:acyl-CoA synthetase (AMP-forming)/AMP-acid ligase II